MYTFAEVKTAGGETPRQGRVVAKAQERRLKLVILEPGRQHEQLQRLVTLAAYRLRSTFVGVIMNESTNGYLLCGLRRQA